MHELPFKAHYNTKSCACHTRLYICGTVLIIKSMVRYISTYKTKAANKQALSDLKWTSTLNSLYSGLENSQCSPHSVSSYKYTHTHQVQHTYIKYNTHISVAEQCLPSVYLVHSAVEQMYIQVFKCKMDIFPCVTQQPWQSSSARFIVAFLILVVIILLVLACNKETCRLLVAMQGLMGCVSDHVIKVALLPILMQIEH